MRVRKIGMELGLPREMVYRHPFPGPGLGVRVLGEVRRRSMSSLLQLADAHIHRRATQSTISMTRPARRFAVFLPVKLGGRPWATVAATITSLHLRAVETIDFMTARWARLPYEFLEHVSLRIINEIDGISRVTYDISGKPPATIEWE